MIAAIKRREFITLLGGAAAWPLQPELPLVGKAIAASAAAVQTFRLGSAS
jgi:hypothetical protein